MRIICSMWMLINNRRNTSRRKLSVFLCLSNLLQSMIYQMVYPNNIKVRLSDDDLKVVILITGVPLSQQVFLFCFVFVLFFFHKNSRPAIMSLLEFSCQSVHSKFFNPLSRCFKVDGAPCCVPTWVKRAENNTEISENRSADSKFVLVFEIWPSKVFLFFVFLFCFFFLNVNFSKHYRVEWVKEAT